MIYLKLLVDEFYFKLQVDVFEFIWKLLKWMFEIYFKLLNWIYFVNSIIVPWKLHNANTILKNNSGCLNLFKLLNWIYYVNSIDVVLISQNTRLTSSKLWAFATTLWFRKVLDFNLLRSRLNQCFKWKFEFIQASKSILRKQND